MPKLTLELDHADALLIWGILENWLAQRSAKWPRVMRIVKSLETFIDAQEEEHG